MNSFIGNKKRFFAEREATKIVKKITRNSTRTEEGQTLVGVVRSY